MAEQSAPVLPGQVTTLSVAMAAGTTIYNGDANNAVWISGNPTPGPGSGMRIGPKGSLSWTDGGSAVYAAADAGVSTVTTLTLSGAVAQLVNPVDVGAAVAAQLLTQGVPSVLVGKTILDRVAFTVVSTTIPYTLPVDVSKYASLTLYITVGKPQRVSLDWLGLQGPTGAPLGVDRTYIHAGNTAFPLVLNVPIKGPQLNLFFTDPSDTNLQITAYASNRAIPASVSMPDPFYQSQIPSRAWGAFSTVSFPDALTTNGGPHHIRGNANLSGQKGYLVLSLLGAAGAAVDVPIVDSGSGSTGPASEAILGGTVILPAGRYFPRWQNAGTAATFSPLLTIVPVP